MAETGGLLQNGLKHGAGLAQETGGDGESLETTQEGDIIAVRIFLGLVLVLDSLQ